jgi:hypothetical protein
MLVVLVVVAAGVVVARSGPRRPAVAPPVGSTPTPAVTPPVAIAATPTPAVTAPVAVAATPTAAAAVPTLGPAGKSNGCAYRAAANGARLPDPACTPGAANPQLSREVLCAPGFTTRQYRNVTEAQKRRAYMRYGIASHAAGEYEIDHLLAIEDGGANDDANLWPEPASPEPGFHQKDLVETYVHRQVCAGTLDLAEAQHQIASDWTALLDPANRAGLAPKQHTDDGDESD